MAVLDHQCGFKNEVTYGTGVVVDRFFEYNSESIEESEGRTEGDPLRTGTLVKRNDRFTPYFEGASGTLQLDVMTKGFGYFFQHMLGGIATSGPTETVVYTHTGTMGALLGKFFTMQINRPFHPTGTNQAFAYTGGKVTEWTVSNSVENNLVLDLDLDFASVDTATALATASYPTSMENFTWAGGVVTIGGSAYDITEISVKVSNNLDTDRRQIRGNTMKKEPTEGRREIEWSINADFDSLTQRNRAHATTRAGALAAIVATWTGPTLLGSTIFPTFQITIPAGRFDSWSGATEAPEGIKQELSGVGLYDGTLSPLTIVYKSADSTP